MKCKKNSKTFATTQQKKKMLNKLCDKSSINFCVPSIARNIKSSYHLCDLLVCGSAAN